MSKYLVVVFPDESKAYKGSQALKDLHRDGDITLYGLAVLEKQADGTITVKDAADEGPVGTAVGMLTGSLIGIIGGPAGVLLGATGGALVGSLADLSNLGVGLDYVDEISGSLKEGTVAVAAEVEEYWMAPVDTRLSALGGTIHRRYRFDFVDELNEREIAAWDAELNELEAELKAANDEAKAAIQARIDETKAKLQDARDRAKAKLDELDAEVKAKVKELQDQANTARDEAKAKIEQRINDIKDDYQARKAKLTKAWELTKEALAS